MQRDQHGEDAGMTGDRAGSTTSAAFDPADPTGTGRSESPVERADRNWNEILQELRVTQTGTQIITGFLLAVAFQPRFRELDAYQLTLYLVLVALAGIATILGLAPVSLHRAYFGRRQKARIVRVGSRLLVADLVVVAALASGVTSLIFDFTVSRVAGFVSLGIGVVVVLVLWGLVPRLGAPSPDEDPDETDRD
ncbi:DUF6328 family protein [Leucobacter rhizosphaerae]|uniref:DUF6328 family protein n=1 Tax=Leucobacter rhizosphaerae TaxID=2932245 RepID=A0ABY4FXN0_9MICO|nr:DUF6328 family protein [Leucobacter rhizosphaerae]UOQ61030.1 DUF6328 family protein [Leucobacter rhizosphaerae]